MYNADRVQEMIVIRNELTRLWEQSPFYAEQTKFFEATILKLNDLHLDSALSMSIGQMSNGRGGDSLQPEPWEFDRDYISTSLGSLVELVMFESFIEILRIYPTHSDTIDYF